ncbi:hypothetical protein EVJ58_g8036 [Rhodofomes roseus]|uniref:Uncharacterized protein n=1 Tax=Rhodofomes roseus TaxID=34475 RepID=A0A4Y9Y086_9APHY|nr:hypothetical protein EVJ58_g8036 [Rhodofomes roseus]
MTHRRSRGSISKGMRKDVQTAVGPCRECDKCNNIAIAPEELAVTQAHLDNYRQLNARDWPSDDIVNWYTTDRPNKNPEATLINVYSGQKELKGAFYERYKFEVCLFNQYITWFGGIMYEVGRVIRNLQCPWRTVDKCPKEFDDGCDIWEYYSRVNWKVGAAANICNAALAYAAKHWEAKFNPFLHIWAVAMFFDLYDVACSSNFDVNPLLCYDPFGFDWDQWARRHDYIDLFGKDMVNGVSDAVIPQGNNEALAKAKEGAGRKAAILAKQALHGSIQKIKECRRSV